MGSCGYDVYLKKCLLPVAPGKLQININNANKTVSLVNEGQINILKKAELKEIEFECSIPHVRYPYAVYRSGFKKAAYFLKYFEKLKSSQKPFQFIVSRYLPSGKILFDTNMKVSMEDYKITEDAGEGFDLKVKISLKQYRDYATKNVKIKVDGAATKASMETNRETANAPAPVTHQTYTVVSGDCLWNIAKQFYGNGSRYTDIYNANTDQISNPNLIYPGQVLIIPPA